MSDRNSGKACHNCRRQRLKCDQSLPGCQKCDKRGQQCLGYNQLLRWEQGIASRGKLVGMTFQDLKNRDDVRVNHCSQPICAADTSHEQHLWTDKQVWLQGAIMDPLLQGIDPASRRYLSYFGTDVCKDLVLHDTPESNRFRELIPLTQNHPILLQIIVANSALHMSNTYQKFAAANSVDVLVRPPLDGSDPLPWRLVASQQSAAYHDALIAKQRTIGLLETALRNISSTDVDVVLAVVLLFIEFELIDSGRDGWKHHVKGARGLIERLCGKDVSKQADMSAMRSFLISNCLVFDILGSSLAQPVSLVPNDTISAGALSLLQDAEGNHCSSFPVVLLQLIQAANQLSHPAVAGSTLDPSGSTQHQALMFLHTAQSFNPLIWATNIQLRSPAVDFTQRVHVASAHQAAVSIYLSRVLLSFCPSSQLPVALEDLVRDVVSQISLISPHDTLFTATTWPAFIAGAETSDSVTQEWVTRRLHAIWQVEPWGLIKGALELLEQIWLERRRQSSTNDVGGTNFDNEAGNDWISSLRANGADWLIL